MTVYEDATMALMYGTKRRNDTRTSPPGFTPFGSPSEDLSETRLPTSMVEGSSLLTCGMKRQCDFKSSLVSLLLFEVVLVSQEGGPTVLAMPTFEFWELSPYSNPGQTNCIRRSLVHCFILFISSSSLSICFQTFFTTLLSLNHAYNLTSLHHCTLPCSNRPISST